MPLLNSHSLLGFKFSHDTKLSVADTFASRGLMSLVRWRVGLGRDHTIMLWSKRGERAGTRKSGHGLEETKNEVGEKPRGRERCPCDDRRRRQRRLNIVSRGRRVEQNCSAVIRSPWT